jgi:hypothetical protein
MQDNSIKEKAGLWANIHAKRKRIAAGSGERMRKPGEKGAPSASDLKAAQESFKTGETAERQSNNPNVSSSRFDGTNSLVGVYKKSTPGQIVKRVVKEAAADAKGYKSTTGGLTQKGRDHYNRISGGNLKAPVTTKPSKLKKGSKAANRRKSFCARMGGMKKRLTSAKTARDPDSRINKALRKWNC